MMNSIRRSSLLVLAGFISVSAAIAQNYRLPQSPSVQGSTLNTEQLLGQLNTITTAVPFLLISPDARAGGMGDAGVASTPDVNSIHWNPSKMAFLEKKMGFGVSYTPWLRALVPDINLAYLTGYYKTKTGTFGGSLRYFSLGDITFTDIQGNVTGQFRPNEFALDAAYARKLSDDFAVGMAIRYIYSNLTMGQNVGGASSQPGTSFAVDISATYRKKDIELGGKKSILQIGTNISNIGAKIHYTNSGQKDFIPINFRVGGGLEMKLDDYNSFGFLLDINKLLVPSPPVYKVDANGNYVIDPATGEYEIESGKDPHRGVVSGMLGSFNDAPAGFKEELKEFILAGGVEYWYSGSNKQKIFAVRVGYFNEAATKGNRKYFTAGFGIRYTVFGLDFSYLIPTTQRNPLSNTLRFTLTFDFNSSKELKKDSGDSSTTN